MTTREQRREHWKQNYPTLKEKEIEKLCIDWLGWNGWYQHKQQQGLGSKKGIADRYILKKGRSIWIEFKTATGRQSQDQKDFEAEIKAAGGEYYVIRSLEELQKLLKGW